MLKLRLPHFKPIQLPWRKGQSVDEEAGPIGKDPVIRKCRHVSYDLILILTLEVEDVPDGFPRVARFLDSDDSFGLYRRFGNIHSRLLLNKQDEISKIEAKLGAMDRQDDSHDDGRRYLRSRELDADRQEYPAAWGESRVQLMERLEKRIIEYGQSQSARTII